jgi:uncharacterized protein (TIGR02246 family)
MIRFAIAVIVCLTLAQAGGAETRRERMIRKVIADFSAARNAEDAAALSRMYADDGEYVPFGQTPARGRKAIEAAWSQLPDWHSHAERTIQSIRFLKPGVAIVLTHVHFVSSGTLDFTDTFVLIRNGARWQISLEETAMPPNLQRAAN